MINEDPDEVDASPSSDKEIKLWRVYRSDMLNLPWYSGEYMTRECYVLSTTWQRAKGIAKDKFPSLFEDIPKNQVLVEEVSLTEERALIGR